MMTCCSNECFESTFNDRHAKRQLKRYRKRGPNKTTRMLLDALRAAGIRHASLLDVGAGIGVVHHELLTEGARSAIHVDAARPHIRVAEEEATRRGHAAQVTFVLGDFVGLAESIATADVVTLDRVICCYPDMEQLVAKSAAKASRLYGAVFPRERRALKAVLSLQNFLWKVLGNPFRSYIHSTAAIDATLRRQGLAPLSVTDTALWRVAVYSRG
ncbi:MAG TPA: class I SAM-dependent methyltransferase [Gemmatimonadaceae bacterium]|nr:class I SAM-dependent methyltransferase [Gemmatimonadaceae bacterium]